MSHPIRHPHGPYRFLPGIDPYSCGVIAEPGHEIVRVTLRSPVPWREGFDQIDQLLVGHERRRADLCALELRSPRPLTMPGFVDFNRAYCAVLEQWGLFVDGLNPVARTNVCPTNLTSPEPVLYAFSYVRPAPESKRRTFIVAGAGELIDGQLNPAGIIRAGEITAPAIAEKARYVRQVMQDRLTGLGADWDEVTAIDVYTIHPIHALVDEVLLPGMPPIALHGLHWHVTRPPVVDIEFEMDLRGVATEMSI